MSNSKNKSQIRLNKSIKKKELENNNCRKLSITNPFEDMLNDVNEIHISMKPQDKRYYAHVEVLGEKLSGLLDSGASPTVINSFEIIKKFDIPTYPINLKVSTADGTKYNVTLYAEIPFSFRGQTKIIPTLYVPNFSQKLLLGITFWKAFRIHPCPLEHEDCNSEESVFEINEIEAESNLDEKPPPVILSDREKEKLKEVVGTFPCSIPGKLGRTELIQHDIDVGDQKPIKQRHYEVSPYVLKKVREEVNRMLSMGVIKPSLSSWSSPVVIVPKPDGRIRLCLDLRKVNAVTKNKDAYPLPNIGTILSRLQSTKFISALDLKDAFWQIGLTERAKEVLAFKIPEMGLYQMEVMPFGATTAAQTMSRLMDLVIGHDLEPYVFVYLDDIIVVTDTFERHIQILTEVAKRIKSAGLTISVEKSRFCLDQMKFLGYVIDARGVRVDPDKVKCILNYPIPKTVKDIRRFIGMAGYYRRFVDRFSEISAPLTDLIKSKGKISWSEKADQAFRDLKSRLVSAPILATPKWNEKFTIHADASDFAVGAVITQGEGEKEKPVAFMSKKLVGAQKHYTTTEKECLAILTAIEHFRGYIEGTSFNVITDHAALTWLNSLKIKSGRLARWIARLSCFDFEPKHKKGKLHVIPDALSRVEDAEEPDEIL